MVNCDYPWSTIALAHSLNYYSYSYDSQHPHRQLHQQGSSQVRHPPSSLIPQVPPSPGSKGPIGEQYLAEEALGLAKSLGWTVLRGPAWNEDPPSSSHIENSAKTHTHLFIDGKADELQDGDYVKTSLGSGTLHVHGDRFRGTG